MAMKKKDGWLKSFVDLLYSKGFKEEECVDCPRGASRPDLNRSTSKMEKRKGAVKIHDLRIISRM
jgi:hypothetical protein